MKLLPVVCAVLISGCGSSKIEIVTARSEMKNVYVTDSETGYLIGIAPCTLQVKNRKEIIAKYDVSVSNWCVNHPECETCYSVGINQYKASQKYEVDGDGTFNVGK